MIEQTKEKSESDILFSKTIKAGKRIYYIDVKQDRHSELYLSITESKRVKEGSEDSRPVFEKHKIFLYREDIDKFMAAFTAAADYAHRNGGYGREDYGRSDFFSESQLAAEADNDYADADFSDADADPMRKPTTDFRLDIDF